MSLVAAYGSDSEDEGGAAVPEVVKAPAPAIVKPNGSQAMPSAASTGMKRKKPKKAKVLVSILPPEIQAALARGASLGDSDDEDVDKEVSGLLVLPSRPGSLVVQK